MFSIAFKTPFITVLKAPPITFAVLIPMFLNKPNIFCIKFEKKETTELKAPFTHWTAVFTPFTIPSHNPTKKSPTGLIILS